MAYDDIVNSAGNVVSALNGLGMTIASDKNGKTNVKKSKELFDYQTQKQYEYYGKQLEEYTKPYYEWQKLNDAKLDVQGLRAAGINPLMAYGGSLSPLDAASLTPAAPTADLGSSLSGLAASRQSDVASGLALSESAKNFADAGKSISETKTVDTFNKFAFDLYKGQNAVVNNTALQIDSQTKLNRANVKFAFKQMEGVDAQIRQMNAVCKEISAHIDLMTKQGRLTEKQIDVAASDIALNIAKAAREEFGLKVDAQSIKTMQAAALLSLRQGDALMPSILFGNYLQSNGSSDYFHGMVQSQIGAGMVSFNRGLEGDVSTQIRMGNFVGTAKKIYENAVKSSGVSDPFQQRLIGSAAVATSTARIMFESFTDALGRLSGTSTNVSGSALDGAAAAAALGSLVK